VGQALPPGSVRLGGRGRAEGGIDHELQQLAPGLDVAVQGHRPDAELGGDPVHRDRGQAFSGRDREPGPDDPGQAQAGHDASLDAVFLALTGSSATTGPPASAPKENCHV
jgi:hypothetical protein